MKEVLILGLGNEYLSDDGIGAKIVRDLQPLIQNPKSDFKSLITGSLDMLEIIKDYKHLIIIDSIKTQSGIPGSIYLIQPEKEEFMTTHLSDFHDVRFPDTIRLAKELGISVPEKILIIGIEIIEDRIFMSGLSPELNLKYNNILLNIIAIFEGQFHFQKCA